MRNFLIYGGDNVSTLFFKGTQQTLADRLFVTRQAVSRWEGGSRYPDLMTAKKLSQCLEISLDELLSDEDMKQYPEKNAILESVISKNIQTAVLAIAFVSYLILSIWNACGMEDIFLQDIRTVLLCVPALIEVYALTVLLGYGTLLSIQDRINPKIAAVISGILFGEAFWGEMIAVIAHGGGMGRYILCVLGIMHLGILFVTVRYFLRNQVQSPWPVYIGCGMHGVLWIISIVSKIKIKIPAHLSEELFMNDSVRTLATMILLGLLCYMAHELYLKRKRMYT